MTIWYRKKCKIFVWPILLANLVITSIYSFFHYYFIIHREILEWDESWIVLLIPGSLGAFMVLVYFRPRLKLLDINDSFFETIFILLIWFSLTAPVSSVQLLLQKAGGGMTELESIHEISQHSPTKYYRIKNSYIDVSHLNIRRVYDITGKHIKDYDMYGYFVAPIADSMGDTLNNRASAWAIRLYTKSIGNAQSKETKSAAFNNMISEAIEDFFNVETVDYIYLERVGMEERHEFELAVMENKKYDSRYINNLFYLINSPYKTRYYQQLKWTIIIWVGVILLLFFVFTFPGFIKERLDAYEKEPFSILRYYFKTF